MGAAKKLGMLPDEAWLAERVKDGRAVKMDVSMKALGKPDTKLQQRVEHLSIDHVHRLDRMRLSGSDIFPVVVFWDEALEKYFLADGFHRHEMYRRAKLDAIPAYVIQGTRRDAMIYSTMCNQLAILNRKPEDIRKAVMTLLEDEEWFGMADIAIGKHCGVSGNVVTKCRAEYCKTRDIPVPERVKGRDGSDRPYKITGEPRLFARSRPGRQNPSFSVRIEGETTYLGTDKEKAQETFDAIASAKDSKKRTLGVEAIKLFCARNGIVLDSANLRAVLVGLGDTLKCSGLVLVSEDFENRVGSQRNYAAFAAIGRVLVVRQLIDPTARAVVVCYVDDAPPELIEAGRALGVEFLTPDELVASLKGDHAPPETN